MKNKPRCVNTNILVVFVRQYPTKCEDKTGSVSSHVPLSYFHTCGQFLREMHWRTSGVWWPLCGGSREMTRGKLKEIGTKPGTWVKEWEKKCWWSESRREKKTEDNC